MEPCKPFPPSDFPNISRVPAANLMQWSRTSRGSRARYQTIRREFLAQNPFCAVALAVLGEKVKATIVHHKKGRRRYLLDPSTFIATTPEGDRWIHANPEV
ncbi:MAG: hypothetical protein L0Z50_36925, partial [Verrucomicrobiales bacterium]|nr:hypothetical protein [Verrucomicrobiales bacterium]